MTLDNNTMLTILLTADESNKFSQESQCNIELDMCS